MSRLAHKLSHVGSFNLKVTYLEGVHQGRLIVCFSLWQRNRIHLLHISLLVPVLAFPPLTRHHSYTTQAQSAVPQSYNLPCLKCRANECATSNPICDSV